MSDQEPIVKVPVSQIKMAVHYLSRGGFRALAGQLQDALLSQPTPTAEPEHDEACVIWTGDGFTCDCGNDDASRTEPPRIEDMAPGTTPEQMLSMQGHDASRYVPGSLVSDGYHMTWTEKCRKRCKHTRGECFQARSGIAPRRSHIDPSTIRDVTPPSDHGHAPTT